MAGCVLSGRVGRLRPFASAGGGAVLGCCASTGPIQSLLSVPAVPAAGLFLVVRGCMVRFDWSVSGPASAAGLGEASGSGPVVFLALLLRDAPPAFVVFFPVAPSV